MLPSKSPTECVLLDPNDSPVQRESVGPFGGDADRVSKQDSSDRAFVGSGIRALAWVASWESSIFL